MSSSISSPIDQLPVPAQLTARVVRPGARPLLHGYDVQGDLARSYGFGEVVLAALTGEVPDERKASAFDVAMVFASAIGVGEAPAHAAVLARLCGATPGGILAVAATGLSEQARVTIAELADFVSWLDAPSGDAPVVAGEDEAVERLRTALAERGVLLPALDARLGLTAAIVAVFHACGLRAAWQLEAAWCAARWPVAMAEAMAAPADFASYPMRLPAFEYVHEVSR